MSFSSKNQLTYLTTLLSLALVTLAVTGCSLGKPASASFASVIIPNRSADEIRTATLAVFREDGYTAYSSGSGLVFDKEGSRLDTISRDGLVAAQAGAVTLIRVKVEVVALGPDSHRLQGHAFMVSGAGDSFFEDEHKLADFRGGPYQKLLDEVAKRLK
jgi:hypothetical protein